MPSAKSGSPVSLVAPAAPGPAEEADSADPGEVAEVKARQLATKTGKYGSVPFSAHKNSNSLGEDEKPKTSWIEIELVDESGAPVAGAAYIVETPSGDQCPGTLDEKGFARVDNIESGNCKITFPYLDKEAWQPA